MQRRESSHTPCIRLSLVSRVDAQFLKHSKLSIQLHAISFNLSSDAAIFGDLATLLKAPDGAFLDVVPTESTRIYVNVTQSLLRLLPLTLPSSLALKVGGMKLSTQLKRHGVVTRYDLQGNDISLWAADVRRDPDVAQFQLRVPHFLISQGYP